MGQQSGARRSLLLKAENERTRAWVAGSPFRTGLALKPIQLSCHASEAIAIHCHVWTCAFSHSFNPSKSTRTPGHSLHQTPPHQFTASLFEE
ncbi:uncharacterized protein EI90DRAFT_999898 [Cantharellus anzutake]|uniref:uncharacterized protein n=1 Tax=Cantharellus anzutake TaxID=1750568 RepID=UPI0019050DD6|nr:uncharacterized protein EI90DRAFT_999898 [Cantharellus anzutake]KAF8331273.1 hypothetical protein EI90DRAFT_999898 [Cantharellus anzutake]